MPSHWRACTSTQLLTNNTHSHTRVHMHSYTSHTHTHMRTHTHTHTNTYTHKHTYTLTHTEAELGNLNIGSRPARRKADTTAINELRAIPWQFAWTQTRLILPSWLGIGEALLTAIAKVCVFVCVCVCVCLRDCVGEGGSVRWGCIPG